MPRLSAPSRRDGPPGSSSAAQSGRDCFPSLHRCIAAVPAASPRGGSQAEAAPVHRRVSTVNPPARVHAGLRLLGVRRPLPADAGFGLSDTGREYSLGCGSPRAAGSRFATASGRGCRSRYGDCSTSGTLRACRPLEWGGGGRRGSRIVEGAGRAAGGQEAAPDRRGHLWGGRGQGQMVSGQRNAFAGAAVDRQGPRHDRRQLARPGSARRVRRMTQVGRVAASQGIAAARRAAPKRKTATARATGAIRCRDACPANDWKSRSVPGRCECGAWKHLWNVTRGWRNRGSVRSANRYSAAPGSLAGARPAPGAGRKGG